MQIKYWVIGMLLLTYMPSTQAQNDFENLYNFDWVYADNIRSVQFHVEGVPTSIPVYDMSYGVPLYLAFDDMDGDIKSYSYRIVHCNANWQPSDLSSFDVIDGFDENPLRDFRFSRLTKTDYTTYEQLIPNPDVTFRVSGNYLLIIYDEEEERKPAITLRFIVSDQKVNIDAQFVFPSQPGKGITHQELDILVYNEDFPIRNPRSEVQIAVLQNNRWDNAVTGLPPNFEQPGRILFDYTNKIVFPAGKEFRYADLRSIANPVFPVTEVHNHEDRIEMVLEKEPKRFGEQYAYRPDINGNYVLENLERAFTRNSAEYIQTLFTLYSPEPLYDQEIYLFGKITQWRILPQYKMTYNPAVNGYVGKFLLRQGYYDYAYVTVPVGTPISPATIPNMEEIEGHWHQTQNAYTIIVYYRPFGSRYDQIIATTTVDTRE